MKDDNSNDSPILDQKTLEDCRAQAIKNFEEINQHLGITPAPAADAYPYGGTVTVAGVGFIVFSTVTPMEFTNGVKLSYHGEGFGMMAGAGVFVGTGIFSVDPATLNNIEVAFALATNPLPFPHLGVTWILNEKPIGGGVFVGAAIAAGSGGGKGKFNQL